MTSKVIYNHSAFDRTPYKMTDVVRQNMSIAQTGAIRGPMSQESKDKKSASLKGKNLGRISPLKGIKVGPKEGSKSEQIIKLILQGLSRDVVAEIVNVRLAYVGKIVRRHKEKLAEAA